MIQLELIEDFTLFLFLHMGHVDGSLHPNERDTILEKMTEIFPQQANWNDRLTNMELEYRMLHQSKSEDLLKISLANFAMIDPITKRKIHQALYDIINANGRVSEEETQTLLLFRTWLTAP